MIKKLDDEMGLLIKMHHSTYYRWGHSRSRVSQAQLQFSFSADSTLITHSKIDMKIMSQLGLSFRILFLLRQFVPQCTGTVRSPSGFEKEQFRSQINLANQNGSDVWLLFDRLLRQSSHGLFYFYFCIPSPRALKRPVKGQRKSNHSNSVALY